MRLPAAAALALILSILLLNSSHAFGLNSQTVAGKLTTQRKAAPTLLFQSPSRTEAMVEPKVPQQRGGANTSSLAMGFFGRSGLIFLSVFLVKFVYAVFFPSEASAEPRCPWYVRENVVFPSADLCANFIISRMLQAFHNLS